MHKHHWQRHANLTAAQRSKLTQQRGRQVELVDHDVCRRQRPCLAHPQLAGGRPHGRQHFCAVALEQLLDFAGVGQVVKRHHEAGKESRRRRQWWLLFPTAGPHGLVTSSPATGVQGTGLSSEEEASTDGRRLGASQLALRKALSEPQKASVARWMRLDSVCSCFRSAQWAHHVRDRRNTPCSLPLWEPLDAEGHQDRPAAGARLPRPLWVDVHHDGGPHSGKIFPVHFISRFTGGCTMLWHKNAAPWGSPFPIQRASRETHATRASCSPVTAAPCAG